MRREGRFWKRRRTMKVFGRGGGRGGGGERDDRGGAASAASMAGVGVAVAVKSEEEEDDGTTEKLASLSRCLLSRVDVVMEPSLWATARDGIRRLTIISRSFEEFSKRFDFLFCCWTGPSLNNTFYPNKFHNRRIPFPPFNPAWRSGRRPDSPRPPSGPPSSTWRRRPRRPPRRRRRKTKNMGRWKTGEQGRPSTAQKEVKRGGVFSPLFLAVLIP